MELNDSNEWKASFKTFPFSTKDSKKYRYRAVEIALGYDKGNNTTNWANTIGLVSKINNSLYTTESNGKRYNFGDKITWDYTTDDYFAYSTTIDNLPDIYQNNSFRSVNTFGSYRVYPGNKDGVVFGDNNKTSHTTTIENKLEASTGFKIIKHWVDDDHDRFGTRPEKIEIRLQKKQWTHDNKDATAADIRYEAIEKEFSASGWTDITTNQYFISNKDIKKNADGSFDLDTWELDLQNLPLYDDEGYRIAYRAFEIGDSGVLNNIIWDTEKNYQVQNSTEGTLGNYYLSEYSLRSDSTGSTNNITVEFWNTLNTVADKTISVDKDWIIKGESESGDTYAVTNGYQSTVQAVLTYSNGSSENSKTAQLTSNVDLTGTGYQFAWNKIPAYAWVNEGTEEAPNYQKYTTLSNIEVKEIKTKLGTDASENEVDYTNHSIQSASDTAVIGTFTAGEQDWLVKNTKSGDAFTITNTPLTKHSLEVRYTNDADAEKSYQTRPNNAFVKLQYRVEGETTWKDVDDSIKAQLLNSVTYENVKIENANATPTAPESANPDGTGDSSPTPADEPNYKAIISQLPEFVNTESGIKKYQYRIVETDVQYGENSKLNVPYDDNATKDTLTVKAIKDRTSDTSDTGNTDRTVAGYTYAYDNTNAFVTKLEKTIALVGLKGSKVWDDQGNKFNTRPTDVTASEVNQTNTSSIKVALKKGTAQTDVTANTTVAWKDIGSNKWSYETTQVYPKYATGTDTYETYTVTETMDNNDYEVSYGEGATSSVRDSISGNSFNCTEITNKLKKKSLEVEKHWPDLTNVTGLNMTLNSVTYTVQQKLNGEANSTYKVLKDSSNNPITVTLECSSAVDNVSKGTISELPLCNLSGIAYEYRILETEVKVSFTDSSSNQHEVTYKLDLENKKIEEFIGTATSASREKAFDATVLNADTFAYQIGPFDAKYEKTDSVYKYTNSIHTASASAEIEWSETKVGETALDATLVQKFRPDQLDLELQRKVKGEDSWENVTGSYTTSTTGDSSVISISNILKTTDVDAAKYAVAKIKNLPIFVFVDDQVKEYEYRIVEKQFGYNQTDSTITARPITYTGSITSDFDGSTKELNGLDTVNSKAFYNCSNKNVTVDGSYEYKTEIKNTLKSGELINLVDATLSGTVLWKDNANALNKRPDGTDTDKGVSLRIKAKKADTNETYELVFTMGNTTANVEGNSNISIPELEKSISINVSWTKNASNWNYTITGLPMFDKNGNYLTYSICSEKNPTDYDAKADNSDISNQHTDENQKYAFGTVTEFTSGNYETTAINHVDFVENMTTKLSVTKKWEGDEAHYWQTRPNDLYVALQYRLVDKDGNPIAGSDWQFWDNQTYSLGTDYPSAAKNWTEEFKQDSVVNSPKVFYKLHKPDGDGSSVTQWEYEATLPQYAIQDDGTTYQFIQYRIVEIGKNKTGNLELLDETKKPGSNPNKDELSHIGSYYMKEYATSWEKDTGYSSSTITNAIDTRQSITVKKIWGNGVSDEEKKSVKVKLIGMVSNHEGHVTNVESVFEHELPIVSEDNKIWEFIYEDLPQYNLDSQTVEWHVEEILVDGIAANDIATTNNTRVVATTDGKWIGFYGEDTTSGAGTINRTFTVTNIPATSAKLTVNYADDLNNIYDTRFTSTKAVLQYRVKDSSDGAWQAVGNTTENKNLANQIIQNTTKTGYITGTVALENNQIVISQQNVGSALTYVYAIQNLPKYYDKDVTQELEYRLVEIQQGTNISVSYSNASENSMTVSNINDIKLAENQNTDSTSAGYEYAYTTNDNNQSDAILTKTLKKVYIPGKKIWVDENNAYGTRADKENGAAVDGKSNTYTQDNSSAVKVTVLRSGTALSPQPTITWNTENAENSNEWKYESGVIPKYVPQSDSKAEYSVSENYNNPQYESSKSGFDLTNKLKSKTITVNKVWRKDATTAEYDITFLLQSKTEDAATFETIPNYGTKVLSANATEKSVKWENLPSVTSDGKTIQYKVVEQTTNANFRTEEDFQTDANGDTTYAFTNIEEQTYTVIKKWVDLVDIGTAESSDHKFSAKGVLQQSVENGEWVDVADKTWEFSDSFAELSNANNEKTTTFANLPKYTKDGKSIKYQGIETYVNGNAVASQSMYKVEHVHNAEQQKSTITNTLDVIHVKVVKKDSVDQKPLKGAKFGLYAYNNNSGELEESPRYEATSDETGVATFQVFILGIYCLKEMEAPTGYTIATISEPINLTEGDYNKTKEIIVEDPRKLGELTIYKKDKNDDTPLNDVKFELYKKQEGNFVQEMWWFLTGKLYVFKQEAEMNISTGTAKITDIPWGEYYIVETETNTGYVLSTDKYYFKVNAETVEHPIELWSIDSYNDESKKITGNIITNYKNKFSFQKKAVGTGDVLTGGAFEIHKASGEKVGETFTLNNTDAVEFEGFAVGEYYIKEVTAPTNYGKAEDLYFSITDIGEIKDASGQVIANQILVMEDMPLCNFNVIKKFEGDAAWKKSVRPSEVEIQLYKYRTSSGEASKTAVGTPKKITVNTTNDTYNYTFENLPMYEVENGTAHALSYIAEEVPTGDTMYTVSYSTVSVQGGTAVAGCTYEETITNEIVATDVQNIFISKVNNGGPQDAEFDLQVTFWKVDTHKHFYIDSYSAGTWNDGTKDIDSADPNSVGQDGMLKIKHNQTVKFTLPKGVDYSVEEIFSENTTPEYKVEPGSFVPNNLGDNKQRISITNTKQVYTAINNTTENLDNTGSKQTNAGGTVAVIEHTSDNVITENPDKVDYTSGKYCVHWAPKEDWENENTFTIKYKDTANGEEKEITVSDYLDEKGNLIPAYDESHVYLDKPCYEELYNRYGKFEIKQDPDTKEIYLYLSDVIQGMPYLNQVNVEFVPTIAVANITEGRVGGGVKIEEASDYKPNSEGMLENQTDGRISHKTRIYAQAEEGYYIDLRETELGLVGTVLTPDMMTKDAAGVGLLLTTYSLAEDMPLLADGTGANKISLSGNRFSKTLQYDSGSYTLTGGITILESKAGNNPTSIVMEVDELSIPIDIGIVFKKYVPKDPNSNAGGTEENEADTSGVGKEETAKTMSALTEKDGVAPKTGDDNSLYVWYLLFLMSLGYILNDYLKTRSKKDQ